MIIKGVKKWVYYLLSIVLVFSACLGISSPANAFEIGEGSALVLIEGHIETSQGRVNGANSGSDLVFPIPEYDTTVNSLYFEFNTSSGLTPDFMFTFNIRYQAESGQNGWLQLDGVLGQNMDVITLDCVDAHNNTVSTGGTTLHVGTQTITCSYLAISHGNYNNFESRLNSRIATFMQPVPDSSKMVVTPGFVRHFNTNGLTEDDRDWLESVLPQGTTIGAVEQGVENALQNQADNEKTEMEETQTNVEDTADNSSETAENATQTVRQAIENIIGLVRDTPASDCNIRINFRIDTGVMNMCQMPDQFKTLVQAITTIAGTLAILHISYELLLMYVDHIRSFQDGGKENR